MDATYVSLIAGFVGALVGASASIAAIWIQSKAEDRRDLAKLAVELAIHDQKVRMEKRPTSPVLPASVFIHYHLAVVTLASQGKLTPAALQKLSEDNAKLCETIDGLRALPKTGQP